MTHESQQIDQVTNKSHLSAQTTHVQACCSFSRTVYEHKDNGVLDYDDGFSSLGTNELNEDTRRIDYQGESPDEQALVSAASAYGYTLFERTSGHIVIDVNGEKLR